MILLILSAPLAARDANSIVEAADKYRGFKGSFAQQSTAVYYKNDKEESSTNLKVYINDNRNSLVRFMGPGRDKGQIMLMSGNNIWMYIPGTRNPIRLSPQQRLLGQASNGDVARTNYSDDYDAELDGEEKVENINCHRLILTANEPDTTYQKIVYFVKKTDNRPVKALFYAKSGKLLKTGYFKKPGTFLGRTILRELHLYDELKKNEKTVIKVEKITREKLPASHFNYKYLPRIR